MTDITDTQARPGYDSNQVVAMFENYAQATAARAALEAANVPRSRIEIVDQSASADDNSFSYERHEEGIWGAIRSLFLPDDDAHVYAEGVRRGHAMVVVRVDAPGDRDSVLTILEAQNPIDVQTKATEWREGGWSGVHEGQAAWEMQRIGSTGTLTNTTPNTAGTSSATPPVPLRPAQKRWSPSMKSSCGSASGKWAVGACACVVMSSKHLCRSK